MSKRARTLKQDYRSALKRHLEGAGESALNEAHGLGRRALAEDLGVLEMAALQHEVVGELLKEAGTSGQCAALVQSAGDFAVESLTAFEMTHRGFREENTTLRRLNEKLNEKMEEGAKRVAHGLHDEAGQILAALMMTLDAAIRKLPSDALDDFREVRQLAT